MRNTYRVELEDPPESLVVETDGRDIRRWESTYATSYVTAETSITQVTQLVHIAAVRAGQFRGDWEAFDGRCVAVRRGKAVDPTEPVDTPPADMESSSAA